MALFLLHSTQEHHRNPVGMHAALVDAADAAAARTAAASAAPFGDIKVGAWDAVQVADTATLPQGRSVRWFEGPCASLLGRTRGGSPL